MDAAPLSGEARESPSSCLPPTLSGCPPLGPLAAWPPLHKLYSDPDRYANFACPVLSVCLPLVFLPLQKFYSDPDRYAYSFQHYVLLSRVQEVGGRSRRTVGWQGRSNCTAADSLQLAGQALKLLRCAAAA